VNFAAEKESKESEPVQLNSPTLTKQLTGVKSIPEKDTGMTEQELHEINKELGLL